MKILRKIAGFIFKFFVFLLVLIGILTSPIDHSPWKETSDYSSTFQHIDSLNFKSETKKSQLQSGWSKVNITPDKPTKLVGFKPRGPYEQVHDSLFVRSVALKVADQIVCIVSYDLLLAPPEITEAIKSKLRENNNPVQLYFSATHTHTGFGGWDSNFVSRFITGEFDDRRFNQLVEKSISAINQSIDSLEPASIGFGKVDAQDWVKNRVDNNGLVDSFLRYIKIETKSGRKAAITSFSAHTTNIPSKILELSRDYPGILVDKLEKGDIDFAMFCGGMMGSHKPKNPGLSDFTLAQKMGEELASKVINKLESIEVQDTLSVVYHHIPVGLPEAQLRLTKSIAVRSTVFNTLLGELEASITYLKIGDILLLGMPCDFSGELFIEGNLGGIATSKGLDLMITSFNGDYIGYITSDKHYDTKAKEEVRVMNWVGPNKGEYFIDLIQYILEK